MNLNKKHNKVLYTFLLNKNKDKYGYKGGSNPSLVYTFVESEILSLPNKDG